MRGASKELPTKELFTTKGSKGTNEIYICFAISVTFVVEGSFDEERFDTVLLMLASKVVAITGASAGIGRAVAEQCAAAGAAVVVNARRAERLTEVVAAIASRGGRAHAVAGDVTSETDMAR